MGPEWLLVGVVIMNHQTIDLKTESCPFSSNGSFHGFVRAKVVHNSLDCSFLLTGKSWSGHGGNSHNE